MSTKKRILITGATGFIGSRLVAQLVEKPELIIRCLVRKQSDLSRIEHLRDKIELVEGDITQPKSLNKAFKDVWGVVNLAGYREFWSRSRKHFYQLNELGCKNVFDAAAKAGVEKAVQISTPLAYGIPAQLPFDEDSQAADHPSDYGRSKYLGDQAAWKIHRDQGLPLTCLYLAAVIGAGDDKSTMEVERAVKGDMPALIGAGTTYTYLYLGDAVEAISKALLMPQTVGERYLVGKERATTREYFNIIGELADVKIPDMNLPEGMLMPIAKSMEWSSRLTGIRPLLPLDVLKVTAAGSLLFDCSKAERELELNFTPLRDALAEAVAEIQDKKPASAA